MSIGSRSYDDWRTTEPEPARDCSVPLPDRYQLMYCECCGAKVRGPLAVRAVPGDWMDVCDACADVIDGNIRPDPEAD